MAALLAKIVLCVMGCFAASTASAYVVRPSGMHAGCGSESFACNLLGNRRSDVAGYTDRQGRQSTYSHNEVNEYTSITGVWGHYWLWKKSMAKSMVTLLVMEHHGNE